MKENAISTRVKTVRLADIARRAGVSVSTVSRALSGSELVNSETKKLICDLASEHKYDGPRRARPVSVDASPTIAVVIPPAQGRETRMSEPFTLELFGGIGDAMREQDCDFLVSHVLPDSYDAVVQLLESTAASGTIFIGQSALHEVFNRLAEEGRQFVVWGAQLPDQVYCSIGSDNMQGGRRATGHLIRLGRRRIAFIGDTEAPEIAQRVRGYEEALREAGMPIDPQLLRPARFYAEAGMEAVNALIDQGVAFDAIVAASDMIAMGAVRGLLKSGRRVPEDVAVVGYDDVHIAAFMHPALTTVRQDVLKAGRLLVAKMMRIMGGQTVRSERLSTDLIVRESCGA